MARELLNEVMSGKVSWDKFISWLKPKEEAEQGDLQLSCSQRDFVVYFINYLRNEVSSILQKSSGAYISTKKPIQISIVEKKKNLYLGRSELVVSPSNDQFIPYPKQDCNNSSYGNSSKSLLLLSNIKRRDNDILCKSADSNCDKSFNSYSTFNEMEKSGSDTHNYSRNNQNNSISPYQASKEISFLNSCHLSPIASELLLSRKEKHCSFGSDVDSPNNRIMRKDRNGIIKNRISLERSTSSPCSSPVFNISEHAFPVVGSPVNQNSSRRRRIKPTRLTDVFEKGISEDQNRAPSFGELVRPTEPSSPFKDSLTMKESDDITESDFRDLLRLEKQKLLEDMSKMSVTSKTPQSVSSPAITASPDKVNFKHDLCLLAKIYNFLIDNNFICNVVTEINFILSLLNVQEEVEASSVEKKDHSSLSFFVSIHECVYFATTVLNEQRFVLSTLDKSSLKALINNKRISLFVPELWMYLCAVHESHNDIKRSSSCSSYHASVCFQSDTDNRENFPCDRTFATFRKQRDAFYEILSLWEDNHSSPGWSFNIALGQRVRNLLCLNNEPVNFIHFARLFRTQLLGSCWKTSNTVADEESNTTLTEVLKCFKEGNPDKYSRLHERLVKSSNLCRLTEFPERQEFFKDFIFYGNNAFFNAHLIDSLWLEIETMNSANFAASEVEEDITVDEDTKQAFITCVRNLQLLAKFLGYILFLPYRSNNKLPDHLMANQLSLRQKTRPPIDVLACLQEAIQVKKLTLTVPWIIQFMSMIDNVSCNLSHYGEIMTLLFAVYRNLPCLLVQSVYGSFMLKVCLGWLFEHPQLPESLFYGWCSNEKHNYLHSFAENSCCSPCIDELNLIELETLHIVCPNLESVKCILTSDMNNTQSEVPPRHITPVLVTQEKTQGSSSLLSLELELEEKFLEGQPPSLRKTIEFVSERISSCCVKFICGKPLSDVKDKASKMLDAPFECDEKTEKKMPLGVALSLDLKKYCQDEIPKICLKKCSDVLSSLLGEDLSDEVKGVSLQIAVRMSLERINSWVNSHITPALFSKQVNCKSSKPLKTSHVLSCGWRNTRDDDALSPAEIMVSMRSLLYQLMKNSKITNDDVDVVLNSVLRTLHSRRDLIPSAERTIGALSVDLVFVILAHQPKLMNEDILQKLHSIWKTKEVATSECFLHLISSRNIMILNKSCQVQNTWPAAAKFFCFALENNIVTSKDFESQCVAIFRQEWPTETLKHLALCFEEVVKLCQCSCDVNFVFLLELVSDLCQDLQNEDF